MVIRDQPQVWSVEATRFHGTNVVRCEVITEVKQTPVIGAYLPPSTSEHLPYLGDALTCFQDQDFIVIGDLSAKIGKPQNLSIKQVSYLLT